MQTGRALSRGIHLGPNRAASQLAHPLFRASQHQLAAGVATLSCEDLAAAGEKRTLLNWA